MLINESNMAHSNEGISIVSDGRSIPFISFSDLLRKNVRNVDSRKSRSVVIVSFLAGNAALGVERLLGTATVVVKPLPPSIRAEAFVSGATLDADGNPELVLDPVGIVAEASMARQAPRKEDLRINRQPILIIDDSLTTRMLEQSILESAGYHVELAVSAEDALEKTRGRKFSIFIVDVEMPGMDGFEFVERIQSDPLLRGIPCILVTSRDAPEDRLRGQQVGARAYIVKGEFNQDFLLQTIRGLLE
jgi:two-component system chemotaxis sensor kinase CheA